MAYDFSRPEYLYRLARSGEVKDREVLAQAVASLLHTQLTSGERGLAESILLQLLQEAELDLRIALADQLAHEANCPHSLLEYLIYKNPFSVSKSVLRHSEKLTDEYLIEVAKFFDNSDYWMAIAQRKRVGEDLSRFLIETEDEQVCQALVENKGSHLPKTSMPWLVNAALHIPGMQKSLLARPEVTPEFAIQLYWHVSEELRADIQKRFDIDSKQLERAMERIVHHRIAAKKEEPNITQEKTAYASDLKRKNEIAPRVLVEALKKDDIGLFVCLWAALLTLKPDLLLQKFQENFIHTLAVLSIMARVTRKDFNTMFLQWRRKGYHEQDIDLSNVMQAYDHLDFAKARDLVIAWRDEGMTKPTVH